MKIRPATAADAGALAAIHIRSWRTAYRDILPEAYLARLDEGAWTADWTARLARSDLRALLAVDGEAVLGFAALAPAGDPDRDPREWHELANLHVRADLRGRGVGTGLFEAGLAVAERAGARRLTLWVARANRPAQQFYERLGMTADGSSQRYDLGGDVGLDEVRYRLELPGPRGTAEAHLRHTLATAAYRGAKTLRDPPPGFGSYSAGPGSRTPAQILAHINDLWDWMLSQADGRQEWHDSAPGGWDAETARFHATLERLAERLRAPLAPGMYPGRLFQGAVADALTHIGQLAMLRRMAGAPVRGENYHLAMIVPGQVGPAFPPPAREFE